MITPAQLIERKNRIGSSDSAAIIGVDPYQNAADIYVSKTSDLEQILDKEAIDIGVEHERPLLFFAAKELGLDIRLDVYHDFRDGVLSANLDAQGIYQKRIGIEAKTTSSNKDWGSPGTDEIPDKYIIQAQHQCAVADLDIVYFPVLMAKYDRLKREIYVVRRNEDLIKTILEADYNFWYGSVLPRIPPSGMLPAIDVLSRVIRNP